MKTVTVRIRKFEEYKGRKDVEHNSWFRCSNRLLEDHEFFGFTHEEMLVWIYLLSIASQKNTSEVVVSHQHAHQVCRLSPPALDSALLKLKKIKCIELPRTRTIRGRYVDGTSTCATDRQTDRQTESALHEFGEIWNANCAALPKLKEWNEKRETLVKKLPDSFDGPSMLELTKRVTASDFLTGKVKKWRASFEWVLKKRTEILEGNYDNSSGRAMKEVL